METERPVDAMEMLEIRDEREEHQRYSAYVGKDRIGFASWILVGETVLLPYVEVDPDRHDLGIGSMLVRRVYDDARAEEHTVLALCPFARRWADLHPAYHDVARPPKAGELNAVKSLVLADSTMRLLHREDVERVVDRVNQAAAVDTPMIKGVI